SRSTPPFTFLRSFPETRPTTACPVGKLAVMRYINELRFPYSQQNPRKSAQFLEFLVPGANRMTVSQELILSTCRWELPHTGFRTIGDAWEANDKTIRRRVFTDSLKETTPIPNTANSKRHHPMRTTHHVEPLHNPA